MPARTKKTDFPNGDLFASLQPDLFSQPEKPRAKPSGAENKKHDQLRSRLLEIINQNDDFRLLERIPLTASWATIPQTFEAPCEDERLLVILDTETTGLSHEKDAIIELGLVKVSYLPSKKRITGIIDCASLYEDPGFPIQAEITMLTGITDEKVRGQRIDDSTVADFLKDASLVVAHNAAFDRPFFDARFPGYDNMEWACSLTGIDWEKLGFQSRRQEDLLLHSGYFYEAHRASIDCLALTWLLHINQTAFANLLDSATQKSVAVRAFGAPFDAKEALKARGYRWHDGTSGSNRHWWKEIPEEDLPAEKAFLDELYLNGSERAGFTFRSAATRFKKG